MLEMRGSEGLKVRIKGIRLGLLASLVCKASADSFPEFDDIEIQQLKESLEIANMINGTKTYCNLVRTIWVKSKGYNADIFSYDARQLDEKMEKFFAEVSKRESRMAPTWSQTLCL